MEKYKCIVSSLMEDGWLDRYPIVLVDQVFWYCWRRWPREVLTEGGKCFVTSLLVRPGQMEKELEFIVLIHVVTTGLKQIRWYQMARFCLLSSFEI